jgi:hypothetical protein
VNKSTTSSANPLALPLVLVAVAAVCFAALWLSARVKEPRVVVKEVAKPIEVVKMVPVETVKEVPVEKVKEVVKPITNVVEVPARLSDGQQAAIDFSSNYLAAPNLSDMDDALYRIDAVNVRANLRDPVRKVVSEEQIRNRCQLTLRRSGIRLDESSPYVLGLQYDGFWNDKEDTLVYGVSLVLFDSVTMARDGDLRRTYAIVWVQNDLGSVEKSLAQQAILSNLETNTAIFARKLAAIQSRTR